jgi:hypothetical protein
MNVEIVEEDIDRLDYEIQMCETSGIDEMFFKFTQDERMFGLNVKSAQNLLVHLQALMTSDTLYLSIDVSQFVIHH